MYCGGTGPNPPPETCEDNHNRCAEWAARGECEKNPNYMLRNCKKSCKVCSKGPDPTPGPTANPPPTDCKDGHSRCAEWAARDPSECTKNPKYMLRVCKKSCKVCKA